MAKEPQKSFKSNSNGKTVDGSDALANMKNNLQTLTFEHCISKTGARFKAFLVDYQDQYESNWNQEDVYGRNDSIQIFQNTKRKISVTWTIPAFGAEEAAINLSKVSKLVHMLYPAYELGKNQTNIAAGPVFKVRFANLICNTTGGSLTPLYCTLNGLSMRPDLEAGFFQLKTPQSPELSLFPKSIELSTQMNILHVHPLGWIGSPRDAAYPADLSILDGAAVQAGVNSPADAYDVSSFPYGVHKFRNQKLAGAAAMGAAAADAAAEAAKKKPPTDPKEASKKRDKKAALKQGGGS
jgi:hypothetical protein